MDTFFPITEEDQPPKERRTAAYAASWRSYQSKGEGGGKGSDPWGPMPVVPTKDMMSIWARNGAQQANSLDNVLDGYGGSGPFGGSGLFGGWRPGEIDGEIDNVEIAKQALTVGLLRPHTAWPEPPANGGFSSFFEDGPHNTPMHAPLPPWTQDGDESDDAQKQAFIDLIVRTVEDANYLPKKVHIGGGRPVGSAAFGRGEDRHLGRQAMSMAPHQWEDGKCRWHKSAESVGAISEDGHVFTKTAGPRRSRLSNRGAKVELASICMVFDASLRCGGVHRYRYEIMDGELGAADGAGFVFDSKVRRNNIQRMRSVFLNQRGRICLRNNQQVTKLQVQLPPLTVGVCLDLLIDLDSAMARFNVSNAEGAIGGSADVSLEPLFDIGMNVDQLRCGFFCAVVTGSITIGLH